MPDWSIELEENGNVAGVDEAGRGPAAGPVVAAAVAFAPELRAARACDLPAALGRLDDSKKLTARVREEIFAALGEVAAAGGASIAVGIAEPEEIDRANILQATLRAMARAVGGLEHARALSSEGQRLHWAPDVALIDGNKAPKLPCRARTVVRGDSVSFSIAAASIIAKVTRDRLMTAAHARWPVYGFDRHAGYPTEAHCAALAAHGPCPIHRRSWAPVRDATERAQLVAAR